MKKVISCGAPYGQGGLGQHFKQIVEDARAAGQLQQYYGVAVAPSDAHLATRIDLKQVKRLMRVPPMRYQRAWKDYFHGDAFDRAVARRLTKSGEVFIGFGGKCLRSFARARSLGMAQVQVVAANSHVNNVRAKTQQAAAQWGMEGSWLNEAQRKKTLREYAEADLIYVASEYTRQTFLAEGFADARLKKVHYAIRPGFAPGTSQESDGVFRVVYTGSLSVAKGIPVLVEAFAQVPDPSAELVLIGHWTTRAMKQYLQKWQAKDARLKLASGDPRPYLHRASVYVHPSYEDGYSYSPVEALACGVPVVVTEDTGMKEHVREGENGFIVPTGEVGALYERLQHLATHPLVFEAEGST